MYLHYKQLSRNDVWIVGGRQFCHFQLNQMAKTYHFIGISTNHFRFGEVICRRLTKTYGFEELICGDDELLLIRLLDAPNCQWSLSFLRFLLCSFILSPYLAKEKPLRFSISCQATVGRTDGGVNLLNEATTEVTRWAPTSCIRWNYPSYTFIFGHL